MEQEVEQVRQANQAFYRAFRERDPEAMEALWAREAPVACTHPGMDVVVGRERVMESWRGILSHRESPNIVCGHVRVHVLGAAAYVTCCEGSPGDTPTLAATNVFVHEAGQWKLVHHHAGPLSPGQQPGDKLEEPAPPPSALN